MPGEILSSDIALIDLLRERRSLTVSELAEAMEVTATAVRQRLNRLMEQGYVERKAEVAGRGRPSHHYRLTDLGRRESGSNFADLAVALWQEVRAIGDAEVRRGLLRRISMRLADTYASQINGDTLSERMTSLASVFEKRRLPVSVDDSQRLPVLTVHACPYPELAEQDNSICAMERILFSEMLGESVRLDQCRLYGDGCCTFKPSRNVTPEKQAVGS